MNIIPTLSSKGHAKTPEDKIDAILLYYQSLNPSMTNRHRGKVRSLQNAIWEAGIDSQNMDRLTTIVQADLTAIFSRNFPEGATVDVTHQPSEQDSSKTDLLISANVIQSAANYDIANVLEQIESRFVTAFDVQSYHGV